jgi:tetratricopeptide (TPR) repeat protein
MRGGELRSRAPARTGTAVILTTTAILLSAAAPDSDQLHPDPRMQGVGVGNEHAGWSMAKLEEQVKLHPKSVTAHLELGNANILESDIEKALPEFNRAIELDPKCARAYIGRYYVYGGQHQFRQALAELKKAYEAGPPDMSMDALNLQAALHKDQHQFPEALAEYTRVIESNLFSKRRLSYVYVQRGIVNDRLGKIAAAISDYTTAAKLDPTLGQAFLYRGNDYRGMGDFKRALADYGHLLDQSKVERGGGQPGYGSSMRKNAFRDRAILYSSMGRPDLAKADRMAAYKYEREDMDLMPFRDK